MNIFVSNLIVYSLPFGIQSEFKWRAEIHFVVVVCDIRFRTVL